MPFRAVGPRRHGVRMPPAEGGRQLAPWKVWDGGNTRPPLPLACNVLLCLIHFGLQFLSPCWLIFSLPTAQSQRAGLWSYKKEQAEWSGAWGIPHHKMLCLFRHEKNNNFFFFSLDIRQGDLQKNLSTFHPQKNVVQYFFIKKYTTGIPCSLLFHVLFFFFNHSQQCLTFGTTLPALEMCSAKPLSVSGRILPDSSKA